jgi:hypothetical protein
MLAEAFDLFRDPFCERLGDFRGLDRLSVDFNM